MRPIYYHENYVEENNHINSAYFGTVALIKQIKDGRKHLLINKIIQANV